MAVVSGSGQKVAEKAIGFFKPQQIMEILAEAERLKLQVLLRYSNDGKAVRGYVERADPVVDKGIRIGGISAAGDAALANYNLVKVEFVLLSKKLFFVARVRARASGRIMLAVPDKLYALERRTNARFRIPKGVSAFVEFEARRVELTRFDGPFNPVLGKEGGDSLVRMMMDDISLGGAAVFTRFGAVAELLRPEDGEINALLYFPKTLAISVPVSIRWTKKSTVHLPPGKHDALRQVFGARLAPFGIRPTEIDLNEIYYRIGLQFSEVSKELDAALRGFIHLVQTAESM